MRIAICGLINSENIGEEIIAKSLEFIIAEQRIADGFTDDLEFIEVDIKGVKERNISNRKDKLYNYTYLGLPLETVHYLIKYIAKTIPNRLVSNFCYIIRHWLWQHSLNLGRRLHQYFSTEFENVDLIVIDGAGLLEYSFNEYQEPLALISRIAERRSIPIIYNAIGRAGEFDKTDYRCKVLMSALQNNQVKYISARDSVESVQECAGNRLDIKLLADAAFCSSETFNTVANNSSDVVGIGLIRGNAFNTYGSNLNENQLVNLYVEISRELERKGYKYQFFTNGFSNDYELGVKVIQSAGLDDSFLASKPYTAKDLMDTISNYCCLITCRMHSSIAAFSMGIPSIVLSWNDKVDKYMNIIGYPDRCISSDMLYADYIVSKMENALIEGVSEEKIKRMKNLAMKSVASYKEYLH